MTTESESFWCGVGYTFVVAIFVVMFSIMLTSSISYGNGQESMQKDAVYYGYGVYAKNGNFLWKEDMEKENFLKDLEFFKRNEKKMREMPNVQIPLNKIDPSQPF